MVFPDGTGVNPGTRLVNNPSYPGILDDYRRTFGTLESLKPNIFLSYHSDDFGFAEKRARAATGGVQAFWPHVESGVSWFYSGGWHEASIS